MQSARAAIGATSIALHPTLSTALQMASGAPQLAVQGAVACSLAVLLLVLTWLASEDALAEHINQSSRRRLRPSDGLCRRASPHVVLMLLASVAVPVQALNVGKLSMVLQLGSRVMLRSLVGIVMMMPLPAVMMFRRLDQEQWAHANARLLATADYLRAFVGHVSHETRVPLQAAVLATEELTAALASKEDGELTDQLAILGLSLRAAEEVLNSALELQRCEFEGRDALRGRWGALGAISDSIEAMFDSGAPEGTTLSLECASAARVFTDFDAVQRILGVVLKNAIRFHQEESPIRVTVELEDTLALDTRGMLWPGHEGVLEGGRPMALRVEVHDLGPGIGSEDKGNLFRPFLRVRSGESIKGVGTGVGLAMCQAHAMALGGSISHRAREDGRGGSVFSMAVPVLAQAASPGESPRGLSGRITGRRASVRPLERTESVTRMVSGHSSSVSGHREQFLQPKTPKRPATDPDDAHSKAGAGRAKSLSTEASVVAVRIRGTREERAARRLAREAKREAPEFAGATVMVVEDVASTRLMMARALKRLGAAVLEAEDGDDAMRVLRGHVARHYCEGRKCVDLVLLDKDMPVDGFVFLENLARLRESRDPRERAMAAVRVVGCTAHGVSATIEGFIERGAVEVLLKPASSRDFARVLRDAQA